MPYYIRVLGREMACIPVEQLRVEAAPAIIDVEQGEAGEWQQLILKHSSGEEIAVIERNPVEEGELGGEELNEFIDEVPSYKPESAVDWLRNYLPTVKVIYAFQLLNGTDVNDGWTPLHKVYDAVWNFSGGILQADNEGFSNEEGYTILWQFGENVSGTWNVGVLADSNRWVHFEMELGDQHHREAFLRGQVPDGAKLL